MTLNEWIDRQLHKLFDQPAKEPLPEQMRHLLDRLAQHEKDETKRDTRH